MAGTRALSCDRYGSGTLHPGQVLGGSLPLLSPPPLDVPTFCYACILLLLMVKVICPKHVAVFNRSESVKAKVLCFCVKCTADNSITYFSENRAVCEIMGGELYRRTGHRWQI